MFTYLYRFFVLFFFGHNHLVRRRHQTHRTVNVRVVAPPRRPPDMMMILIPMLTTELKYYLRVTFLPCRCWVVGGVAGGQALPACLIAAFVATNFESVLGATTQGKFPWLTNEVSKA